MIDNNEEDATAPSINWFVVDQKIPARQMFQLAVDNWIAAQSFGAYGRLELPWPRTQTHKQRISSVFA